MSKLSMLEERISGVKEEKFDCEICEDTGIISKTEWSGTDDSYEVEFKCSCRED